jgi:hypothetical protein
MELWWQGLTVINKAFFLSAVFFSVLYLWQLVSMVHGGAGHGHAIGGGHGHSLGGHVHGMGGHGHLAGGHGISGHDAHIHHHGASGHDSDSGARVAFTFVSLRSLMTFGTLFSWAGTLYLLGGTSTIVAIIYSAIWGLVGMFLISFTMYWLVNLQEIGTMDIHTALGEDGTVYIEIPGGGRGQVRVKVAGIVSHVKARSRTAESLAVGTHIRVVGVIDSNTVEVQSIEKDRGE